MQSAFKKASSPAAHVPDWESVKAEDKTLIYQVQPPPPKLPNFMTAFNNQVGLLWESFRNISFVKVITLCVYNTDVYLTREFCKLQLVLAVLHSSYRLQQPLATELHVQLPNCM